MDLSSVLRIPRILRESGESRPVEVLGKGVLAIVTLFTLLTTFGIIVILARESFGFFEEVSVIEFLFGTRWEPLLEPKSFGVLPLVCGTLLVVFGSLVVALPLGLATAIYLSQYASSRARSVLKPLFEILGGIPTVVFGYFALTFITPILKQLFPTIEVFNALSASLVVGFMILPMISSLCDDALCSIPKGIKEGGYAIGATSFEVITAVLLPSAARPILAAVILAFSRAIGETMAVTLAAGATPQMTANPLLSIQTMTAYVVQVALGDTPAGTIEYLSSFAVGALLFLMTLFINSIAIMLVNRGRLESM